MIIFAPMNSNVNQSNGSVSFFTSLWRSQATSLMATGVDFTVFIILFHLVGIYYVTSSGIGAFCGAIVSFFQVEHGHLRVPILR